MDEWKLLRNAANLPYKKPRFEKSLPEAGEFQPEADDFQPEAGEIQPEPAEAVPPEAETPPRKLRLRPPERSEPRAQREMGRSLNFRGGVSAEGDCRRGRGLHFTSRGLEVISRGLEDTSRGLGFFEPRFLIGQVCHS